MISRVDPEKFCEPLKQLQVARLYRDHTLLRSLGGAHRACDQVADEACPDRGRTSLTM
jgi:hypothetical protein